MNSTYNYTGHALSLSGESRRIYALCFIPEKGGKLPAVVLSHGYNSSHADLLDYAEALAAQGKCGDLGGCRIGRR